MSKTRSDWDNCTTVAMCRSLGRDLLWHGDELHDAKISLQRPSNLPCERLTSLLVAVLNMQLETTTFLTAWRVLCVNEDHKADTPPGGSTTTNLGVQSSCSDVVR